MLNIRKSSPKDCTDSVFVEPESRFTSMYGTSSMAWIRPDSMALTRAHWSDIRRQIIFLALAGCGPLYAS